MLKVIFTTETSAVVMDITDESVIPANVAIFDLPSGGSTFAPRYALIKGALVDNYTGQTDDAVAAALQKAEASAAAALVAKLQATTTTTSAGA